MRRPKSLIKLVLWGRQLRAFAALATSVAREGWRDTADALNAEAAAQQLRAFAGREQAEALAGEVFDRYVYGVRIADALGAPPPSLADVIESVTRDVRGGAL